MAQIPTLTFLPWFPDGFEHSGRCRKTVHMSTLPPLDMTTPPWDGSSDPPFASGCRDAGRGTNAMSVYRALGFDESNTSIDETLPEGLGPPCPPVSSVPPASLGSESPNSAKEGYIFWQYPQKNVYESICANHEFFNCFEKYFPGGIRKKS